MPWSHHSHSGQFCGHAHDKLEDCVLAAIRKGMSTFCLTEHITRSNDDLYPEEVGRDDEATLAKLFDEFYREARRLQATYADHIEIFVGFEGEWIREASLTTIQRLLEKYELDLFVGSVHHVRTIPIDYDIAMYHDARSAAGGTDELIFEHYFDSQYAMLQALQPPVVGHFDLIRLKSDSPNGSFRAMSGVWDKAIRNLKYIAEYGGILELNSSSLRKGMVEAYPQVEMCQVFLELGGRFTLSDDSHGIDQVGLNYDRMFSCIEKAGIDKLWRLTRARPACPTDARFPEVEWHAESTSELRRHTFWTI
ncbi:hypothetical protein BAUCODRAFT_127110 [Baudoinia panamericana UAMH 10762]|uniref:Histidinol-phosphatase n=1 Tax=Baudoinia panamericana (strain UAMH 10762) TaxID=717646 RepID=M2M3Q6_BAUPA|nr:uncharacterized protein BAUCODRAFT_127110 [Baudoinia panamericana UAMH 10762]EMC91196.1 hypothetical protein BAUCODRAFT_127110 [Baudoinia panamericana UAMH 10762]